MGHWLTHSAKGIDARAESLAVLARDREAFTLIIGHLAEVLIEPDTLRLDGIAAAGHLGFFDARQEAVVYRLVGTPPAPQVLAMGQVRDAIERGQLIWEAQRRDAL
jgi:hypothetical protein